MDKWTKETVADAKKLALESTVAYFEGRDKQVDEDTLDALFEDYRKAQKALFCEVAGYEYCHHTPLPDEDIVFESWQSDCYGDEWECDTPQETVDECYSCGEIEGDNAVEKELEDYYDFGQLMNIWDDDNTVFEEWFLGEVETPDFDIEDFKSKFFAERNCTYESAPDAVIDDWVDVLQRKAKEIAGKRIFKVKGFYDHIEFRGRLCSADFRLVEGVVR